MPRGCMGCKSWSGKVCLYAEKPSLLDKYTSLPNCPCAECIVKPTCEFKLGKCIKFKLLVYSQTTFPKVSKWTV